MEDYSKQKQKINLNRRDFLGLGLDMVAALPLLSACTRTISETDDLQPLMSLKAQLGKSLILRGQPEYEALYALFNGRYSKIRPKALALPQKMEHIIEVLKFCRENKIPINIRGGGHCFEDFSTGEGVVLDLQGMNKISFVEGRDEAWVEGGARLEQVIRVLGQRGYVLPTGNCGTVGVGGLTLGGGYGFLSRKLGLTCDSLRAVELITYRGQKVHADEKENSDLLWACRGGGGGNFGVVTQFKFQIYKASPKYSAFSIDFRSDKINEAFERWQSYGPTADRGLTTLFILTPDKKDSPYVGIVGLYCGNKKDAMAALAPLLKDGYHSNIDLKEGDYLTCTDFLSVPKGGSGSFKSKSDYFLSTIPNEVTKMLHPILNEPDLEGSVLLIIDAYRGKIAEVGKDETAFSHRDALFSIQYRADWSKPEQMKNPVEKMHRLYNVLHPHASGYSYVNYCDKELKDWKKAYYGKNLERLEKIKKKFDPDLGLKFSQSLG